MTERVSPPEEASVNSAGTQTRFSFYNAEDYLVKKETTVTQPNRFHFYNADDAVDATPKIRGSDPSAEPSSVTTSSNNSNNNSDSVEILKSLQEHEQQRLEILGTSQPELDNKATATSPTTDSSNPYEDAINEALQLLRKHRNEGSPTEGEGPAVLDTRFTAATTTTTPTDMMLQTPPERDRVLQSRPADDMLGEAYQAEIEARRKQRQERMARYASRLAELKQEEESTSPTNDLAATGALTPSSNSNQEEDVQRGVERVLLAILERAHNSRQRPTQQTAIIPLLKEEEKKSEGQNDALLRAMSDLLRQSSPSTQDSLAQDHQELDRMVERIFQEPKEEDVDLEELLQSSTIALESPKAVPVEQEDDDKLRQVEKLEKESEEYTDDSDDEFSDDDDDSRFDDDDDSRLHDDGHSTDSYDDDDSEAHDQAFNGVLGPLSMMAGGTTGVVLETDSSEDTEEQTSILNHISNAAINLVAGVASKESTVRDKYSTFDEEEDSSSASSESSHSLSSTESEGEVHELTRTICAHLFPEGMPDRQEIVSRVPKWDESNPDEPGYRIIRLSKYQLENVQREYEQVIDCWKQRSDPDIVDGSFERDLKEAEDLLDREEQKAKTAEVATASDDSKKPEAADGTATGTRTTEDPDCLEHFPGVRPAGKGEMGDLEYFHLPVIFKSHVTGFEPTKDLHLEAGNIVAGQYLVEGELGSAAFSTAYRCIDLNSVGDGPDGREEVCLKVIKNTKDFFDQSLDEIKILELLRQTGKCHENHILEMKTFFYHREHLIIVTELLRQNLFEFGKFIIDNDEEPYFTIPRLSYVTRQALLSMRFIHNIGLVHSDVKPENILLSSYSRAQVKLIDFGSSCYLTDRQSSYIQSRSYRAPEVVLGLPYDGKIDIWSLGCVVAEMFTGEVTFQNDSVVSMLSRIEGISGKTPTHMIDQGRQSAAFFTRSGLLFEKVESKSESDDTEEGDRRSRSSYDIFQPKRTTLAARLGFEEDLMLKFDAGMNLSREQKKQAVFVDFVRSLLTIDPDRRPTAAEALQHPWMEYAATLTEADVKYPSE